MKNLQIVTSQEFEECPLLAVCSSFSVDVDGDIIYGASSDRVFAFECKGVVEVAAEASLRDEGCLGDDAKIVCIQYICDQSSLCIATSDGELIMWNLNNVPALEVVGSVSAGIVDVSWSRDHSLLVVLTGSGSVILMTSEFEAIVETSLHSDQFGEAELVNVGWGKKETQFHGSQGKMAAKKKTEGMTELFDWDDRRGRITWRGDDQFFAVHFVDATKNCRLFKIWNREGVLHSTCEPTSGLGQAVAFKTQGNLLACSVYRQNEHRVAFFEKNGLQHGDFVVSLPSERSKVRELSWNLDSSILAIYCDIDGEIPATQVQLWTTSNYHWHLKQCLEFSGDERVAGLVWDEESPLKLHATTRTGRYFKYTFTFSVDKSSEVDDRNDAIVAVVDGDKVKVTPFARCVVPPPMCAYQMKVPTYVHCVVHGSGDLMNDVVVICIDGSVHWFSQTAQSSGTVGKYGSASISTDAVGGKGFQVRCPVPCLRAQAKMSTMGNTALKYHHFCWVEENILVACSGYLDVQHIVVFHVCWETGLISEKATLEVERGQQVIAMDFNSVLKLILVELDDGSCYKFDPSAASLHPCFVKFPRLCYKVSLIHYAGEDVVIGLTDQFRFFVNGNEVAQDCTSYAVHRNFVLLTTHSHSLRSLNLRDLVSKDVCLVDGESTRALERGSKVVCLIPRETKVVLQMPRGNLEVIHPRSLLLEAIQDLVDRVCYDEAFELCRKHRVNMNVLVDHNITQFVRCIAVVVRQLQSTHNINLLLNDLKEENLVKTMYSGYYKNRTVPRDDPVGTKVDVVCQAFYDEMKREDNTKFFHSILMTFLKRSPADTEGALLEVKSMKDAGKLDGKSTDEALKFLIYMVDVNGLFDVAMGTYDLKLLLLVAEKSQKDPKEYLPYLNELGSMPRDLMKYTIDVKLRRFGKALLHISRCGPEHFGECMKLLVDEKLYSEALTLYSPSSNEYKDIALAYAEYLGQQKQYDEAGMMYFKAEEFTKALCMFEESKNWRLAFCCASKLQLNNMDIVLLARKLAGLLSEGHMHRDAAFVLETYADDYEEATLALISGHVWDEALRIIYKHKRTDLFDVHFKPSLLASAENFLESIERTQREFGAHVDRLLEVRKLKDFQSDLFKDSARPDCDLYSDASSVADGDSVASSAASSGSRSSRKTGMSSKSRQKLSRKKWSLRRGGPTEEFALVEAVHKMASIVHNWKSEMGSLLRMLVLLGEELKAGGLQKKMEDVVEVVDRSIPLIWNGRYSSCSAASDVAYGPHTSSNSIVQSRMNDEKMPLIPIDPILVNPPTFDKKETSWKLNMLTHKL